MIPIVHSCTTSLRKESVLCGCFPFRNTCCLVCNREWDGSFWRGRRRCCWWIDGGSSIVIGEASETVQGEEIVGWRAVVGIEAHWERACIGEGEGKGWVVLWPTMLGSFSFDQVRRDNRSGRNHWCRRNQPTNKQTNFSSNANVEMLTTQPTARNVYWG